MNGMNSIAGADRSDQDFSPGFQEVLRFCSHIQNPSPNDVRALTAIYRCLRPSLGGREKVYTVKILGLMRVIAL